jgi:glycosyltransferase involved in cell wall biosynthesis
MRDLLPIGSKPWMQLEVVYNPSERVFSTVEAPQGKKVVMYSGALGLRYGLGDLVEAFSRIKGKEYELWLCGAGNARKMITDYAKKDDRIHYLGVLARNEVLALQKQATVLVNPRHKTEEYTKYSFPSKTMEFLASGTPVIMSHLDSIPDEYDDYIFYFDDESVEGMKNLIESVCEKPREELREFGLKASEFILSQKTSTIQAKRLYDFLSMS